MSFVILLRRGFRCCRSRGPHVFTTTLLLLAQAISLGIANATARVQAFRDVDAIHNRARRDDRPLAAETSVIYEALVTRVIISMGTHSFDPVLVGLQSLRQQG